MSSAGVQSVVWAGSSVVEQEPFKLLAVGSIPTPLTNFALRPGEVVAP